MATRTRTTPTPAEDLEPAAPAGLRPSRDTAVLPEVQQRLLDLASQADARRLAMVDLLVDADACGGPPVDSLLALDAGLGLQDRRGLWTVARVLPHLPTLRAACATGQVGFDLTVRLCQVASANRLTVGHLALLDGVLAQLLADDARWDPDDLVAIVRDHAIGLRPDEAEQAVARTSDHMHMFQDIFGSGTMVLDATPETFQLAANVIEAVVQREGLLDRTALEPTGPRGDDEAAWAPNDATISGARAAALVSLLTREASGRTASGEAVRPVPSVQVVVDLDSLVGDSDRPARLLGGARLTAGTLRGLVERDGADLTAIVVDERAASTRGAGGGSGFAHASTSSRGGADLGDGERFGDQAAREATVGPAASHVLGVGRRHRVPPGWLRQLVTALQPRCVIPGCRKRVADIDHAERWADGGATDLANLSRLCRTHHREKDEHGLWQVTPSASGTVTVTHVASGWTAVTRPPGTGPPAVSRHAADRERKAMQPRLPLPATVPRGVRSPDPALPY